MIWDLVPISRHGSFSQFDLDVYDAVVNFNIRQKGSILILFKKLSMISGEYTSKGCQILNEE